MLTLQDMLDAKEQRSRRRHVFQQQYPSSSILNITLNIPGTVKDSPLLRELFRYVLHYLQELLPQYEGTTSYYEKTGPHGLLSIPVEAAKIKKITCNIEENFIYGRLWDIDVYDTTGQQIASSGRKHGRICLLCGQLAAQCMREQRHSKAELQKKVASLLQAFQVDQCQHVSPIAEIIGEYAVRATLYEAAAYPSPGLVDPFHQGSHRDMDFYTFIDSSCVLHRWFSSFYEAGLRYGKTQQILLPLLRMIGTYAERDMYWATNQINTHKGLIFSMGLLLGSLGRLHKNQLSLHSLYKMIQNTAAGMTEELRSLEKPGTAGERFYKQYGITGIRGEAEKGFPTIFNKGLPTLAKALRSGESMNKALIRTLFSLISQTDDTTILCRQPHLEMLHHVQSQAGQLLDHHVFDQKDWQKAVLDVDREWVSLNLSPGGSADLLSLTYFLYELFYGQLHRLLPIVK